MWLSFLKDLLSILDKKAPPKSKVPPSTGSTSSTRVPGSFGIYVLDDGMGRDIIGKADLYQGRVKTALALPYVAGFGVQFEWCMFAPATAADAADPAKYNYGPIDYALSQAAIAKKKIALKIICAAFSPQYVKDAGSFTFTHPRVGTYTSPIPWGDAYWTCQKQLLAALKRYDGNPLLRSIAINGPSTLFGVETNWPCAVGSISPADLAKLNLSLDAYVKGWKASISNYVTALPNTQLALAINNLLDIPGVTKAQVSAAIREIRDYALSLKTSKPLILENLGMGQDDAAFFPAVSQTSDYMNIVLEKAATNPVIYESGPIFSLSGVDAVTQASILKKGLYWKPNGFDLKYPDIVFPAYVAATQEAATHF